MQCNIFECGRVAITMRLSHKIDDGTSLATFVNAWASMSRGVSEGISPSFDADIHFSRRDTTGYNLIAILKDNIMTERFVFQYIKHRCSKIFGQGSITRGGCFSIHMESFYCNGSVKTRQKTKTICSISCSEPT